MDFGDVLRRCAYGATGYVRDISDVDAQEHVIRANLPVLTEFPHVVVAANYPANSGAHLRRANAELWRSYFADCTIIDSPLNRGHAIGAMDLDVMLVEHCRATGQQWLCKAAFDMRLSEEVLRIPVDEAQFYYLNALSYDALAQYAFDRTRFTGDFFFPQTTFFVMDVLTVDELVSAAFLDESWAFMQSTPGCNGRLWEYLPRWSCELFLGDAVRRNGLAKHDLASDEQWDRVIDVIIENQITDCSLKGVDINGICHLDRTWAGRAIIRIAA